MPLDTAVVGTGTVARNDHLPMVTRNPRTRLAAVCDVDVAGAREATTEYGGKAYGDTASMLAAEDLDWVHVATPVGTHRDIAAAAIEAGVPTTVQKPATVTTDELDDLLALADRENVPVSVVHNWLYYPVVREVRERVRRGDLGRIRAVETTVTGEGRPDETDRESRVVDLAGGEFEEGMPHPLYLTHALGGDPRDGDAIDVRTRRAGEYDRGVAYDGVTVQYESEDGALCSVSFLSGSAESQEVRIHGAEGALVLDLASRTVRERDTEDGPFHVLRERLDRTIGDVRADLAGLVTTVGLRATAEYEERLDRHLPDSPDGHYYLLDRVALALERGEPVPVPLRRSRWPIAIVERVREAAERERKAAPQP